jgi:hypothetical protein
LFAAALCRWKVKVSAARFLSTNVNFFPPDIWVASTFVAVVTSTPGSNRHLVLTARNGGDPGGAELTAPIASSAVPPAVPPAVFSSDDTGAGSVVGKAVHPGHAAPALHAYADRRLAVDAEAVRGRVVVRIERRPGRRMVQKGAEADDLVGF